MTIPVVITGIVVISVAIAVCTLILLVSNQIMQKNIFVFLSIFFYCRDVVYGQQFKNCEKRNLYKNNKRIQQIRPVFIMLILNVLSYFFYVFINSRIYHNNTQSHN